jgi:ankyrin repeat protein
LLLEKATEMEVNARTKSGNTPLMESIESDEPVNAIALLESEKFESKLKLEEKYSDGRTALAMASWRGQTEVVRLLLEKGADRTATNNEEDTPLHEACWRGYDEVAELLLDEQFPSTTVGPKNEDTNVGSTREAIVAEPTKPVLNVDAKNEAGRTPLFCAVFSGQNYAVDLLLEKGAKANEKDNSNESILGCAARVHESYAFLKVLERVTDINVVNDSKQTPVLWLIRNNMERAAMALLNVDKEVDMETHPDHFLGPLHEAIRRCSDSLVVSLLNKKANALEIDPQGRTGLHLAAACGRLETLQYMLDQMPDLKRTIFDAKYKDTQGRNLLHHASCKGDLKVVGYLLQDLNGKAAINEPDNDGWTPLHWAAKSGREELFDLLLAHGADPTIKEALNNETAYQLLQRYDYWSLIDELPALASKYGKTIATGFRHRPPGYIWSKIGCDGCLCAVSSPHHPTGNFLTQFSAACARVKI